jgi:hypothetical protein
MRRHFDPFTLTARAAALIAALLALTLAAGASAAEPPSTIEKPADQVSTVGAPITTVVVKGTNLATLTAKELPAGLELTKVSETEWTVTGTPTTVKAATTVTLEASNKEAGPIQTTTFKWKIAEALPTIKKPAEQTSTAGVPIATLVVKGTNLASLTAKALPAGLELTKVSEVEWDISGTPSTVKAATTVTLEASNKEAGPTQTTTFKWTIGEALPTIVKPADQVSAVGVAIAAVSIKGTNLATLTAKELPTGLELTKVSETEWTITGTPTTVKAATTVTLEASNKAEAPKQTTTFKWSVTEAQPTLEKPADQSGPAEAPIATLIVKGTNLATLTAKGLPTGLVLTKVSETEWTITGTPTAPQAATTVTLEASNKEDGPVVTTTFQWSVAEVLPTIEKPADQVSTAGAPIAILLIKGTDLATLTAKELPAGLVLAKVSETEWTIAGTPTTVKAATTVTLEASNKAEAPVQTITFQWTIGEALAPASPPVVSAPTPESPAPTPTPIVVKVASAGRLGTVPTQKPGKSLTASFLCEVTACRVVLTATVTAGKSKFKIRSSPTSIKQGQKPKIALKLSRKQQALIAATLKKHGKVAAAVVASIESTVGLQTTKSLAIAVRR